MLSIGGARQRGVRLCHRSFGRMCVRLVDGVLYHGRPTPDTWCDMGNEAILYNTQYLFFEAPRMRSHSTV